MRWVSRFMLIQLTCFMQMGIESWACLLSITFRVLLLDPVREVLLGLQEAKENDDFCCDLLPEFLRNYLTLWQYGVYEWRDTWVHATCKSAIPWQCKIVIKRHTGCPRRNGQNFGRVFLMLKYTDITQNTYTQSWTVTEIMARKVWKYDSCYILTYYQIHIETGRNMWFL